MSSSLTMAISKRQFERIAFFRHALRRFLRFSEKAIRKYGVTPQQYQLILAIKGFPERDYATVGELAEQLQRNHHSVVELINRTERLGLVKRRPSSVDRRQVFVALRARGEHLLQKLVEEHRTEYRYLHSSLTKLLDDRLGLARSKAS
jgi:DNA-binding MarR family transcriptional regulator